MDNLTIAYIAIGAERALRERTATGDGARVHEALERHEGQLRFIQACISHAPLVDRVVCDAGVHAYEVAEPFGNRYADALIFGTELSPRDILAQLPGYLSRFTCPTCGSHDIRREAAAMWHPKDNKWVVDYVSGLAWCESCKATGFTPVDADIQVAS